MESSELIHFSCNNIHFVVSKNYRFIKVLRYFKFSCVVLAEDTSLQRNTAIKNYPHIAYKPHELKYFLTGLLSSKILSHENIRNLYSISSSSSTFYKYQEYLETNFRSILNSTQVLTEDHTRYFIFQLFKVAFYLHSARLIHYSIIPEKVLLNSDCLLKLSSPCSPINFKKDCIKEFDVNSITQGTWYTAPELLLACEPTEAVDIWSIGCIMLECILRKPVFPFNNHGLMIKEILGFIGTPNDASFIKSQDAKNFFQEVQWKERIKWEEVCGNESPEALDLLDKVFQINPGERISAKTALRHPYFREIFEEGVDEVLFGGDLKEIYEVDAMTQEELLEKIHEFARTFN